MNPISLDCDTVIAMYSNYTQADQELRDEDHAEVGCQMSEGGSMWYLGLPLVATGHTDFPDESFLTSVDFHCHAVIYSVIFASLSVIAVYYN